MLAGYRSCGEDNVLISKQLISLKCIIWYFTGPKYSLLTQPVKETSCQKDKQCWLSRSPVLILKAGVFELHAYEGIVGQTFLTYQDQFTAGIVAQLELLFFLTVSSLTANYSSKINKWNQNHDSSLSLKPFKENNELVALRTLWLPLSYKSSASTCLRKTSNTSVSDIWQKNALTSYSAVMSYRNSNR